MMMMVQYAYLLLFAVMVFLCIGQLHGYADEAILDDKDIYNQWWRIVPGTNWCGPGTKAKNIEDLGSQRGTDICCREHDQCDGIIKPGRTLHGLTNTEQKKCFDEGYRIINCKQYQGILLKRCINYNFDEKQPKTWQYYDSPYYLGPLDFSH